jgi:hypothetical protein
VQRRLMQISCNVCCCTGNGTHDPGRAFDSVWHELCVRVAGCFDPDRFDLLGATLWSIGVDHVDTRYEAMNKRERERERERVVGLHAVVGYFSYLFWTCRLLVKCLTCQSV